jgi:hypothetical protein
VKQGGTLLPWLYKCALQYAISKIKENRERLEWSGTHQHLVHADDIDLLGKKQKYHEKYRSCISWSRSEGKGKYVYIYVYMYVYLYIYVYIYVYVWSSGCGTQG